MWCKHITGNDQIILYIKTKRTQSVPRQFLILTIKFNRAVCVSEGIFTDATIGTEIILTHRQNRKLHDNFISVLQIYWLEAFA